MHSKAIIITKTTEDSGHKRRFEWFLFISRFWEEEEEEEVGRVEAKDNNEKHEP